MNEPRPVPSRPTRVAVVIALLALPFVVLGESGRGGAGARPQPKSVKAKAALKKYERAMEKAQAEFDRAADAARKQLSGELDVAMKAALKAGSLDEANAIKAAKEAAASGKPGQPQGPVTRFLTTGEWNLHGEPGVYRADGSCRFKTWPSDGKWEAVDGHTIRQSEPWGAVLTITLSSDGRRAFWLYENGTVVTAMRSDTK